MKAAEAILKCAILKCRPTREKLAGDIADAIIAGDLAPGTRLDEQKLADRYHVSRTPVREALRQLAATGLVEAKPRRGTTVAVVTSEQLEEMFVAMGEIEATCARLAAISMTPVERRRLGALHDSMAAYVKRKDAARYAESNTLFHEAIYAGAHNKVIAEIAVSMRRRLAPYRNAQFRTPGRLPRSHAEHGNVVQAILRGDAGAAHETMLHHVSLVEDAFEKFGKIASTARSPKRKGAIGRVIGIASSPSRLLAMTSIVVIASNAKQSHLISWLYGATLSSYTGQPSFSQSPRPMIQSSSFAESPSCSVNIVTHSRYGQVCRRCDRSEPQKHRSTP